MDEISRLAHAARLGEIGALEAFIVATHASVRRLCAHLVDEQSADDLSQETFVRTVRAIRRFRGDASGRTWVLSIARNTCMDELRARTRRRRQDALDAVGRADHQFLAPDVAEEVGVRDLLARLEPDRRAAFVLTQLLQMTYDEAAVVCGCPTGTIRSRVARARDDLIKLMAQQQHPVGGDVGLRLQPGASA